MDFWEIYGGKVNVIVIISGYRQLQVPLNVFKRKAIMTKVVQIRTNNYFQLKITLNYIKPAIWRRFIIDSNIKLPDLHKVIQTVMGWTNSHLHQFINDDKFYSEPDEDSFTENIDYRKIKLSHILFKEKQSIIYEYDFGDGWEHEIVLEKILSDHKYKYPICIDGERNCPPDDCGGPGGYENLLEIISNPKKKEYDEMIDWLGGDYDPDFINIEEINEMLKEKDYGCITLD